MKFQLYGKLECYEYDFDNNERMVTAVNFAIEFKAPDVKSARQKAKKMVKTIKREYDRARYESQEFKAIKAEVRIVKPVWKAKLKTFSVIKTPSIIAVEDKLTEISIACS